MFLVFRPFIAVASNKQINTSDMSNVRNTFSKGSGQKECVRINEQLIEMHFRFGDSNVSLKQNEYKCTWLLFLNEML